MGPDLPALSEDCNFPIKTRLREVKLLHGALFYVLSLDWKIKEANFLITSQIGKVIQKEDGMFIPLIDTNHRKRRRTDIKGHFLESHFINGIAHPVEKDILDRSFMGDDDKVFRPRKDILYPINRPLIELPPRLPFIIIAMIKFASRFWSMVKSLCGNDALAGSLSIFFFHARPQKGSFP